MKDNDAGSKDNGAESVRRDMTTRRFFTLPVVTLIFSTFMLGVSEFIVVGVLPDIAHDLHVSHVAVGDLVGWFALIYAPATPIGAALSARYRRHIVHLVLFAVFLVGNALCACAHGYVTLLLGRIVIAVVSGTLVAVAMTYATDVTAPSDRTRFIAWVFSGFSLASVCGVPAGTALTHLIGWRNTFWVICFLTLCVMVLIASVLPRSGRVVQIGLWGQFRLFADRRIVLGIMTVVAGASASYVYYTYLTPILRQEIGVPEQGVSIALMVCGGACLVSNLWGGRLGQGVMTQPLIKMRKVYVAHAIVLCALAVGSFVPVLGMCVLIVLALFMYLQNAASQILYMDVAENDYPHALNLAASLNSMSFNIGIACGSFLGGVVKSHCGLMWLGPAGALCALGAVLTTTLLKRTQT